MILYADPSELRKGTRLPGPLVEQAKPLPGLEAKTGADLLLTPLRLPASSDDLLHQHCQAGLLVQRKSGQDIAASITDGRLTHSLLRMREWTERPWLAVVARVEQHGDLVKLDGRKSIRYAALTGALDWWQLRGGYVTVLPADGVFVGWLDTWGRKLDVLAENPEHHVREPQQELWGEPWSGDILTALPGIGEEKARAALAEGSGKAALALQYITSQGKHIPGIGPTLRASARRYLGMGGDEQIVVVNEGWLSDLCAFLLAHDNIDNLDQGQLWYEAMQQWAALMEMLGVHASDGGAWAEFAEGHKTKGEQDA